MPKLKTNKAAKKRYRITKNKKVLSTQAFRRHILTDRSKKKKRQTRKMRHVDPADVKKILRMLPYNR